MFILESEKRWCLYGSLNYYTLLQLEQFCHRNGKAGEIPHVQAFMQLHNKESEQPDSKLMVQREKKISYPP